MAEMQTIEPWPWMNNNNQWNNWNHYSWPLLPPQPQYGWQCPVCGSVYAPHVTKCEIKHRKPKSKTTIRNASESIAAKIMDDDE